MTSRCSEARSAWARLATAVALLFTTEANEVMASAEDGPTTAAGGLADAGVADRTQALGLDVASAAARCDALPLLEAAGGLVVTGPTGTNVADVRIVLARPPS
jgi:hydroxypyruvate reductase